MKVSAQIKENREILFNKVLKAFKVSSPDDNITTFTREDGTKALEVIAALQQDIIKSFPSTNSLKCKEGLKNGKDALTVLRKLARFYNKRVISYRMKIPGTQGRLHKYKYKIAI